MKKRLKYLLLLLPGLYIGICSLVYEGQERLIFLPQKLDPGFRYNFPGRFEELRVPVSGGDTLDALLFHTDTAKGLVFYVHGNAGSLASWGQLADVYTDLGYDVLFWDYRGYGKSSGRIQGSGQLFADAQAVYDTMKKRYREDQVTILGYSIGSGIACHLAAENHPQKLILQAPYYSLPDLVAHDYPFLPGFLLRYKINTNEYLRRCTMPVVLFHGDRDKVIYYGSSLKLKPLLKSGDTLITLRDQGHNGITDNPEYRQCLRVVLP